MADVHLTASAIKAIYSAQACPQPVLQIVDVKKVVPNPGQQQSNQDRYRYVEAEGERGRVLIRLSDYSFLMAHTISKGCLGPSRIL